MIYRAPGNLNAGNWTATQNGGSRTVATASHCDAR
jgi:hypothetical protein